MKMTVILDNGVQSRLKSLLRNWERGFLLIGVLGIGLFGASFVYSNLYQSYALWSFDQILKGAPVSIKGFLAHLSRNVVGNKTATAVPMNQPLQEFSVTEEFPKQKDWSALRIRGYRQSLSANITPPVGRLEIPAIDLSVIVLEGTDEWTLNRAVGHIEGTALPGKQGNFGIAGHRDGFFRSLKDIRKNDLVVLTTSQGIYHYRVVETKIVNPANNQVLEGSSQPTLTLVTCYPFYYVGDAPKRFIVKAQLL